MNRSRLCVLLVPALSMVLGCTGDRREIRELVIENVETLISTESALLAQPLDLAVDESGTVYVSDRLNSYLVAITPDGDIRVIGRAGAGPGEFDGPAELDVAHDTIRVLDFGNGRVQVLTTDGAYIRGDPIPPGTVSGPRAISHDGTIALGTRGWRGLVAVHDRGGEERLQLGDLIVPSDSSMWDFRAIKREIATGTIPRRFRNLASPAIAADGSVWFVVQTEAMVYRFDHSGVLDLAAQLSLPEWPVIQEDFFRRNTDEPDPMRFYSLVLARDLISVADELWLLLTIPDDQPATVIAVGADGRLAWRLIIPGAPGAGDIAVDLDRNRMYLTVPSDAKLVAAVLPEL